MGGFALRVKADYEPEKSFVYEEAADAVAKAQQIHQSLGLRAEGSGDADVAA